jgi:hypothetical protein
MPQNSRAVEAIEQLGPAIRGPFAVLLLYAVYGIGFGVVLVAIGGFTSMSMLGVGVAHIVAGLCAAFQRYRPLRPTPVRHLALLGTNLLVLAWGIAVAKGAAADGALVAVVLGAIYVPIPIISIIMLCCRRTRQWYWRLGEHTS